MIFYLNNFLIKEYNPVLQDRNEECVKSSPKERDVRLFFQLFLLLKLHYLRNFLFFLQSSEKIQLSPGFDVFISSNDLNACNDDRGSATRLLRNLMDVFFDKSTLAKSSINGTGRITHTLDKHVISALFGK